MWHPLFTFTSGSPVVPPVITPEQNSGGFAEVPRVSRQRSIREERELLGIIPKQIKKVIQQVAVESIEKQRTETQAVSLLKIVLAKQDIQPTNQYAELMKIERDRILDRDIKLALMLRAKWESDEADENMAIELLLL